MTEEGQETEGHDLGVEEAPPGVAEKALGKEKIGDVLVTKGPARETKDHVHVIRIVLGVIDTHIHVKGETVGGITNKVTKMRGRNVRKKDYILNIKVMRKTTSAKRRKVMVS